MDNLILAAVDGEGLVKQLMNVLLVSMCVGIVWWLGWYFGKKLGAPAIAMTVWNALFVLIGAIFIINFLMGLTGHGFINW